MASVLRGNAVKEPGAEAAEAKRGIFGKIFDKMKEANEADLAAVEKREAEMLAKKPTVSELKESARKNREESESERSLATFCGGMGAGSAVGAAFALMAGSNAAAAIIGVLAVVSFLNGWRHRAYSRYLEKRADFDESMVGVKGMLSLLSDIYGKHPELGAMAGRCEEGGEGRNRE